MLSKRPYQQCTRCVMDTSDPDITFNEQGHCHHCTQYLANTAKLIYHGAESDHLKNEIVARIKADGKNSKYDCVLGISGGIDSCYSAYIAKQLGLRALVVHLDNGWDSEPAVKNIKYIVNKLGFDYESYVLNWEDFRHLQVAFLKASIVDAEIPTDVAIPAALHKTAARFNVKYIISGGNYATEGILPKSWGYYAKDEKLFNAIKKRFCTRSIKNFPTFGILTEMYYKYVKGIKTIYLLNYLPFSKKEAIKTLQDELDWKYYGGKHYESKYTGFLQSYILPVKFNVDYRRATLSTQICTGEVTRGEALQELTKTPYDPEKVEMEKEYICKKLGLSLQEFEAIMQLPPKTYKDYPNDEKRIEFIYGLYRKLYNKN